MTYFPYKHSFQLLNLEPDSALDIAAQHILDECINGVNCNHVPIFGNVYAVELPIDRTTNFEYCGGTYHLYNAALVSVLGDVPIKDPKNDFQNGADLIICEIAHWSLPDELSCIVYVNAASSRVLSIKDVKDRLLVNKLSQQPIHYGAGRFDGWCDADFPIHASLHLQRMLAIHPAKK